MDAGQGGGQQQGAAPAEAGSNGNGAPDGGQQRQEDTNAAAVIARLNAENKARRTELDAAKAKLTEYEQAKLSETERLTAKVAEEEGKRLEAERRVQELTVATSIRSAAITAGAVDPDLVWRAIDLASVEYDDGGEPKNLEKLLGDLRTKHPILFGNVNGSADNGARGSGAPGGDMNERIRQGAHRR